MNAPSMTGKETQTSEGRLSGTGGNASWFLKTLRGIGAAITATVRNFSGLFGYATQEAEDCRFHISECRDEPAASPEP